MGKKNSTYIDELAEGSEKKRIETKYNPSLLRDCIFNGLDATSIMEKMEIKHRQTLKQYVLKLMSDDRTFYEVKGLYLKNSRRPKVNGKLELKIYLKSIDLQGLEVKDGDEFSVLVENNSIVLNKI